MIQDIKLCTFYSKKVQHYLLKLTRMETWLICYFVLLFAENPKTLNFPLDKLFVNLLVVVLSHLAAILISGLVHLAILRQKKQRSTSRVSLVDTMSRSARSEVPTLSKRVLMKVIVEEFEEMLPRVGPNCDTAITKMEKASSFQDNELSAEQPTQHSNPDPDPDGIQVLESVDVNEEITAAAAARALAGTGFVSIYTACSNRKQSINC